MKTKKRDLSVILILVSFLLVNLTLLRSIPNLDYFPNGKWRTSVSEEQGMDSTILDSMTSAIITVDIGIDSVIIIKNGFLVYEKYFEYYNYSNLHHTQCVTKSIMNILIGIANTSGFITDLDQPILEIFTSRTFANVDAHKQAITIRHLLQMQAGLEWLEYNYIGTVNKTAYESLSNLSDSLEENFPYDPTYDDYKMRHSTDWIQYVLDQPMTSAPGTNFQYNSGAAHLLSAILYNKTGMNTEAFAREYLFNPLNITDYHWWNDSMGISMGGYGLWLRPIDMAKVGYLYLKNGTWNGSSIVPPWWVSKSTQASGQSYGYLWYIDSSEGLYFAFGDGGQYIVVKPEENLVISMTGSEYHANLPWWIIDTYILNPHIDNSTTLTSSSDPFSSATSNDSTASANTPGISFLPLIFSLMFLTVFLRRWK